MHGQQNLKYGNSAKTLRLLRKNAISLLLSLCTFVTRQQVCNNNRNFNQNFVFNIKKKFQKLQN